MEIKYSNSSINDDETEVSFYSDDISSYLGDLYVNTQKNTYAEDLDAPDVGISFETHKKLSSKLKSMNHSVLNFDIALDLCLKACKKDNITLRLIIIQANEQFISDYKFLKKIGKKKYLRYKTLLQEI